MLSNMKVEFGKLVEIDLKIDDKNGASLEDVKDLEYLHGASEIPPALEDVLEGLSPGETFNTVLSEDEGFGERDNSLVMRVLKKDFNADGPIEVGAQYEGETDDDERIIATIVEVEDEEIVIDYNHPLSGKTLHIAGTIKTVRDYRTEDVES